MFNPQLDTERRIIKVRTPSGIRDVWAWSEIDFLQLKKGDEFKAYESDGEIVTDEKDRELFVALSDPYRDELGILAIEVDSKND